MENILTATLALEYTDSYNVFSYIHLINFSFMVTVKSPHSESTTLVSSILALESLNYVYLNVEIV